MSVSPRSIGFVGRRCEDGAPSFGIVNLLPSIEAQNFRFDYEYHISTIDNLPVDAEYPEEALDFTLDTEP